MNTKALNALAGVICRAQEQDRTPMGIAFAVDSAGMHMSPEMAAEHAQLREDITGACLARWEEEQDNARLRLALASAQRGRRELRARVAELEESPLAWAEQLDAKSLDNFLIALSTATEYEPMSGAIDEIHQLFRSFREAVSGAAVVESADKLTALLAPTQTLRAPGVCEACGDPGEKWCPDCGACEAGCYDGHVDNPCVHANASWGGAS